MQHLFIVRASAGSFGCEAGYVGIDLFTRDERYQTLQCNVNELRHIIRATSCNLVRLMTEGEADERIALIGGWPTPWHAGRITLNEVAPDEEVRVYSRVALDSVPRTFVDGDGTLVKDSPWIMVRGETRRACAPLSVGFEEGGEDEILAVDVALPKDLSLASPPDGILFRIEAAALPSEAVLA